MEQPSVTPTLPSGTDTDPDLAVGTTVGEYRVDGKLGQGGFGAVFKASHPLIGKMVAIKVLSQRFSVDREMVSRFIAEARAVNQIRHHNIIDIFSFGQLPDGRHYYVMELIEGETLDRRVTRGRLPLAEAIPILRAIARALDAAHAKGIAHRDLKAENVFLGIDADGGVFPKLLDFGIAKLMGADEQGIAHKTRTGSPMGTPYYMSPEQTKGRGVDHRTDHYAFGVLAYVMLTGVYPIDADDYMTILMRQLHDDPEPASTHVPGLPSAVDDTIAWLMRKDPEERPPDLMTAVRAFEQAGGVAPPDGTPVSAPVRIPTAITATGPRLLAATAAPVEATLPPTRSRPRASTRSKTVLAIAAVLAIGGVVAIAFANRGGSPSTPDAASPIAKQDLDAAIAITPVIDAAVTIASIDAASAIVTITLAGAPEGTEVKVGGQIVGTTPRVQIARGTREVMLVLVADGFHPATIALVPDGDHEKTVKLDRKRGTARPIGSGTDEPTNEIIDFPKR